MAWKQSRQRATPRGTLISSRRWGTPRTAPLGPAISLRTSSCVLLQNEQTSGGPSYLAPPSPLPVLRLEEPLRVDRGHAARAGCGHRLAVARVLHVAAGKDAGHARLGGARPGDEVAALVHLELAREELRVGLVADRDEEALGLERAALVSPPVLDHHARHPAVLRVAQDLVHDHVPHELDLRVPPGAVLHDLGGAQLVAAVEDTHARGVLGEEVRLLHRRVAAAHHHHVLVPEEEAVAGGAGRDAVAHELLLGGEAEELGGRAGGDDERLG